MTVVTPRSLPRMHLRGGRADAGDSCFLCTLPGYTDGERVCVCSGVAETLRCQQDVPRPQVCEQHCPTAHRSVTQRTVESQGTEDCTFPIGWGGQRIAEGEVGRRRLRQICVAVDSFKYICNSAMDTGLVEKEFCLLVKPGAVLQVSTRWCCFCKIPLASASDLCWRAAVLSKAVL
ncbi:hypothetical protein DPEC_G00172320 [Dallia pectoralis]|uniref:Uncharacterized protein n=1 Tax=Dallia pectoralis TaxID=75939 RepID=A0ACC2GDF4_DALPE|nr:hypothetical protein DPEC_G00172320 [Dallia pectoralis]